MKFLKNHKTLVENFASLYLLQIANILIPLVTLPYLVRVLGVEKFGLVSFAQTFAMFFVMFVDFGFNLSIVRLISVNADDKNKVSEIFSSVIFAKFFLIITSFTAMVIIVNYFDKFSHDKMLYLYMFGIVIGQGLFPIWFFQGMQKMGYITILNLFIKLFFLILIFVLIHSSKDYLMYPILLSIGYISAVPLSFYLIKKQFNISLRFYGIDQIIYYMKYSSHFFVSRIAVRIYEGGGLFFVGLVAPGTMVGYYAIADKLRGAITSLYSPISQTLYPYIARDKNIHLYKKLFTLIMILNIIGLSILFVYAQEILELIFGSSSPVTVMLIRIFVFVMLADVPSILLGYPLLGAFGYTNYVNYSLVATAVFFLIGIAVLFTVGAAGIKTIALLYVFTICIELFLRIFGVAKYRLWRENV